jgi:hypothetical protein
MSEESTPTKDKHCVGPIRLKTTISESCASLRRLPSSDRRIHMQLFRHPNRLIELSSWSRSVGLGGMRSAFQAHHLFVLTERVSVWGSQGNQGLVVFASTISVSRGLVMRIRVFCMGVQSKVRWVRVMACS